MKQGFDDKFFHDCQHTRAICYFQYITNVESKHHISIQKFWPLPFDKEEISESEQEELKKKFERLRNNEANIQDKHISKKVLKKGEGI